jgi:cytochrome d ubiquinol oxidase subunit II
VSAVDLCAAAALVGLSLYLVLGGADYGTGIWDLTAGSGARGQRIRLMLARSMGPVWEANHVWLIFVLVVVWTAFPVAFGSIASTLYIPLGGAALGLILRGGAFAFRGLHPGGPLGERTLRGLFALSSILTPFFLGAAVGAIASGRVPVGNASGSAVGSWLNPTSIAVGLIAIASGGYLAAVYTAADAQRAGYPDLADAFRTRALGSGVVAGALALGGIVVVRQDAPHLYDGLVNEALPLVAASAAAGVAALTLVWLRRPGPARFSAAAAVGAVAWGWAVAQRPDLLPGFTLQESAASRPTLVALLGGIAVGTLILAPSLLLLLRLALSGRLGPDLGPPAADEHEAPR